MQPRFAILSIPLAVVGTWFLTNALLPHRVPQLFPLNDPEGTYTIERAFMPGQSTRRPQTPADGDYYRLAYQGRKIMRRTDAGTGYLAVQIASSPVDPARYLGEKVRVTGRFVYAAHQCIQTQCLTLGMKPMLGIALEKIQRKEK